MGDGSVLQGTENMEVDMVDKAKTAVIMDRLTNDKKQREFIEEHKHFDLWFRQEETETSYWVYGLPNGIALCVEERAITRRTYDFSKHEHGTREGFDRRYAILRPGAHYHDCGASITEMIAYVKRREWDD